MMITEHESLRYCQNFYALQYRRACRLLVISLILNVVCGLIMAVLYIGFPKPDYYATNPNGILIKMNPYLTEEAARSKSR